MLQATFSSFYRTYPFVCGSADLLRLFDSNIPGESRELVYHPLGHEPGQKADEHYAEETMPAIIVQR